MTNQTLDPAKLLNADSGQVKKLGDACFALAFASILGSIGVWFLKAGGNPEEKAHAERFGIFVGLWAPTFMILSNRLDRYAEKQLEDKGK